MSAQNFFPIVSKNIAFSKKLLNDIRDLISYKKVYIHFRRQTPPFLQNRLGPQKRFSGVLSENYTFLEKLCK